MINFIYLLLKKYGRLSNLKLDFIIANQIKNKTNELFISFYFRYKINLQTSLKGLISSSVLWKFKSLFINKQQLSIISKQNLNNRDMLICAQFKTKNRVLLDNYHLKNKK